MVVLDVIMPGMDGVDVLREMKKRWPLIEVIMLTGHASAASGMGQVQRPWITVDVGICFGK